MDATPSLPQTSVANDAALAQALVMARPLVTWLLRSGVGYGAFAAALKPVFLAQAELELLAESEADASRVTDSALSLLSGLHRKDVRSLRSAGADSLQAIDALTLAQGKPSAANQVLTRWLANGWPLLLDASGSDQSFDALARSTSKDFHPRAVLDELVRLGLVAEDGAQVRLLQQAFTPDPSKDEAQQLFAANVADHVAAGLQNLRPTSQPAPLAPQKSFLEQSVFADGLSAESVETLHQLSNTLWREVLERVVQAATPLCEQDKHAPQPERFRLGLFSYSQKEAE
jgi:hypothetical protein